MSKAKPAAPLWITPGPAPVACPSTSSAQFRDHVNCSRKQAVCLKVKVGRMGDGRVCRRVALALSTLCTPGFCWGVPGVGCRGPGRKTLRSHQCPLSGPLADFFSPNTKHLLPGRPLPMGGFAPAEV